MTTIGLVLGGKYQLDRRLGGGGMAEVFGASTIGAEGFARRVAIKRVLPGYSDNPAFARMFIAEAKISSCLQHPNIVSVLDFDRDAEHRLYLVMELIDGKDLDDLVRTGPLPVGAAIFVIAETLRGLGHAHDLPIATDFPLRGSTTVRSIKGVVHRDVSPHNVLLSWGGMVKVSDFGIAKARTATAVTATEMLKGKPAYMSPEQANGEKLDGRSDLFAVGVVFWEMLCGRRLFVSDDTRAMLAAVLFKQIPRPRTVRSDIPKDIDRFVMKLLERDISARYPTAELALADLLQCASAPRDGRAELQRVLAERFPADAPVRHSAVRARPGPDSRGPSYAHLPAHAQPTIAFGAPSPSPPVAARPEQPAERRGALVAFSLVGLVVVVIIVVAALSSGRSNGMANGVARPLDASAAVAVAAPANDAGAPLAVTTAPPIVIDAAPSAPPDAAPLPPAVAAISPPPVVSPPATRTASSAKRGRLQVQAFPALTVYLDGHRLHDTPVDQQVSVGKHTLRLVNADVGKNERISITITENHVTLITRD